MKVKNKVNNMYDLTMMIECNCGCKKLIPEFDNKGRRRKYVNGHTRINRNLDDIWSMFWERVVIAKDFC